MSAQRVPKAVRQAILTAAEDLAWVNAFMFWKGEGKRDLEADMKAWREVQDEFPRLREFDGCRP